MRPLALVIRIVLLVAVLVVLASVRDVARSADAPAAAPASAATVGVTPAPATPPAAGRPSALMTEIRAALDAERDRVVALDARVRACTDRRQALALQREIESVKRDTEVTLLRIQATHARRAGRTALADRLEAAVAEMLAPPPPAATPVVRPEPAGR
jgi:hypothetical protein